MELESVSWADLGSVLHHFSSRARLELSWGQVVPESGRKSAKIKIQILVSYETIAKPYLAVFLSLPQQQPAGRRGACGRTLVRPGILSVLRRQTGT